MNDGYVPFFHVGVLVRDIEQAAVDFGKLLGLRFEPVRTAPLVTGEPMRFCYSLPGPPFIELVDKTRVIFSKFGGSTCVSARSARPTAAPVR